MPHARDDVHALQDGSIDATFAVALSCITGPAIAGRLRVTGTAIRSRNAKYMSISPLPLAVTLPRLAFEAIPDQLERVGRDVDHANATGAFHPCAIKRLVGLRRPTAGVRVNHFERNTAGLVNTVRYFLFQNSRSGFSNKEPRGACAGAECPRPATIVLELSVAEVAAYP
jgi:hypothetical protein